MLSATVLCSVAAFFCLGVGGTDPSFASFREFLQNVFGEVNGNWSDVRALPDAEEDMGKGYGGWVTLRTGQLEDLDNWYRLGSCKVELKEHMALVTAAVAFDDLRYTYDFVTDDKKFNTVVGEMYGKVTRLSARLVILADISDTSAVIARLHSFQLLPTTDVTVEQISKQNVTDLATFSPYIENSLVTFITEKVLPVVREDIEDFLNTTVSEMHFNMSSEASFGTTTTTIKTTASSNMVTVTVPPASTTAGSSSTASVVSSTAPTRSSAANTDTSTTTTMPVKTSLSTAQAPSTGHRPASSDSPGSVTSTTSVTPKSTTSAGEDSKISSNKAAPSRSVSSTVGNSRIQFTQPKEEYDKEAKGSTTTVSTEEAWLISNFNTFVDKLLVNTGRKFVAHNMTPYSMPDGEEEMFKEKGGTMSLTGNYLFGLSAIKFGERISIKLDNGLATSTAEFDFTNVTFRFNYTAYSKANTQPAGVVWGHVTNLRGQLVFLANTTASSAINYTFQGLQLLPSVECAAEVLSNETLTTSLAQEISHAAGSYVLKSAVPGLQGELLSVVRAAAERARAPSPAMTTTAGPGAAGGVGSGAHVPPSLLVFVLLACPALGNIAV